MTRLTNIDLFSGAGGMTEGLKRAGIDSIVATDWDHMAKKTFTHNHPNIPFLNEDISAVSPKMLLESADIVKGNVDLISGGPPCQGFSLAGQRLENDPRNSLFLEFVRIVETIQPKIFIFENVRGITSMQNGNVLQAILHCFEEIGYTCQWKILSADDYGVPQARPRFVLVGTNPSINFSFPSPTHAFEVDQTNLFNNRLKRKLTVWDAISDLPFIEQSEGDEETKHSGMYENQYQKDRRGGRQPGTVFNHRATRHSELIQERYRLIPEGQNNVSLPEHLRTKKTNVYKLDRSRPSRTVTCNHRTDLLHPTISRGTTVREAARLQSFDDDYRFFGNLTRKAAWVTQDDQVGNAVPPLLAEALGRSVSEALNVSKSLVRHAS